MHLQLGKNEHSSWAFYPDRYKFFSVAFLLDQDIRYTDRTTYDLLDMFSDIGGLLEIFSLILSMLNYPFARLRLKAVLTSKLFVLSNHVQKTILNKENFTDYQLEKRWLQRMEDNEIQLKVPSSLDFQYLRYKLCCCLFRSQNKRIEKFNLLAEYGYKQYSE